MVKGIIDRIEGNYAVAEFDPPLGQPFCSDILLENLTSKVAEGDIIHILSVNGIDLTDDSRCVYKDITKAEVLKKFLEPLKRKVPCHIEIDHHATAQRSDQMRSLISDLFK